MKLKREIWGTVAEGKVELFTISDESTGFEVSVTTLGASLITVKMPDRNGIVEDIHLGRQGPKEFFLDDAHYGGTMGRSTSIISFGNCEIEGQAYALSKNQMKTHNFHGGFSGFDRKLWEIFEISESSDSISLQFKYLSENGEEGFPGNLTVKLKYTLTPLSIFWEYEATTDKTTVVNLTNHAYWNLEGPGHTIDGHSIQVQASHFQHIRMGSMIAKTLLSLIHILPKKKSSPIDVRRVERNGPDLREVRKVAEIFQTHGDLDTIFLLDSKYDAKFDSDLPTVAQLYSEATGRSLELKSSEPALIVYSGNSMKGTKVMGQVAIKHGAICLEPIRPIDAINLPEFRDLVILHPGEVFTHQSRVNLSIN